MDVGFIGIGRMGSRMVSRLIAAGHTLSIYDIDSAACAPVVARGAVLRKAPDEVARHSELLLTSLPGPDEVEAVMTGTHGVLSSGRAGLLVVETSTIGPAQSRALAGRCNEAGMSYIDAPVSNGVGPAERGELTVMVGGEKGNLERARPILACLGNRIYHLGPIGSGNLAKIANQVVYLSYVAAFSEVARLGRQCGLDVPSLVDVLRHSVGGTPLMTGWEKRIETRDLDPGFRIRRVLKDLDLNTQVCLEQHFDAPVFQAALRYFREAGETGHMENDMTAIYTARP